MGIFKKKYKSKYSDPKYLKSIGASPEFYTDRDKGILPLGLSGIGLAAGALILSTKNIIRDNRKYSVEQQQKKEKKKKETKQKQSMTSNKAYSSKFFGHTDNKNKQEKPVAKKKRKKRTIQDVIDDIRELHEKEEDLLMELEEKTDIDEGEE